VPQKVEFDLQLTLLSDIYISNPLQQIFNLAPDLLLVSQRADQFNVTACLANYAT
jgi:hypothetical protein